MKKYSLLLFLFASLSFAQTQIGNDIDGENIFTKALGNAVALSADGNTVIMGANLSDANGINSLTGRVRVYQNQSGTWAQVGQDIDGNTSDFLGTAVAISADGSIIAISAPSVNTDIVDEGIVQVYQNQSGTWVQIGDDINGENAEDLSGSSISLSANGNVLAIGAIRSDGNGNNAGHVRIYQNVSGTWTQIGSNIDGEAANDQSGNSISLSNDGSIVAIGASGNDGNGSNSGHVRVYRNQSGSWVQIGNDIDGENTGDFSGVSVSLSADGNAVAIGASGNDDNGNDSGHVRVYENQSDNWIQIGNDIDGAAALDGFGFAVDLSDDASIVAIGGRYNTNANGISGHVQIYKNTSGTWTQIGVDIIGEAFGDEFGSSISLSANGNIMAVGAPMAGNNNGVKTGHARVFDLSGILSITDETLTSFKLSPNPAKDQFTIRLNNNNSLKSVSIYNRLGQLVLNTKSTRIDVSDMNAGLYFIRIKTDHGQGSKKLIIE